MADEKQDFESAVDDALAVEKDALSHTEYSGSLEIRRVVDFSPEKYADMTFDDFLMQYNRFEKVRKASQFDYLSGKSTATLPQKAKSQELEAKVKEISEASLHKADEMSKAFESTPEIKSPEKAVPTFEFEKGWEVTTTPAKEIEKPEPKPLDFDVEEPSVPVSGPEKKPETKKSAIEFEDFSTESLRMEGEEEKAPETGPAIEAKKPQQPEIRAPVVPSAPQIKEEENLSPLERAALRFPEQKQQEALRPEIPQVLSMETHAFQPSEPGESVFDKVQKTFDSEWEGERDDIKIKRKMLELTKELFREKLSSRREEIKRQIVVLKNLMAQPEDKKEKKGTKAEAKAEGAYASSLFTTLSNALSTEFTSSLNSLSNDAENYISDATTKFKRSMSELSDDNPARKEAFDRFVFELTAINEKFSAQSDEFWKSITSKHIAAIEQFEASIKEGDAVSKKKSQEKKDELPSAYQHEIALFKSNLASKINSMMDSSSYSILGSGQSPTLTSQTPAQSQSPQTKKPSLKKSSAVSSDSYPGIVSEINQTDEGSLMYYLHSRDPGKYREFERGHISRREALMSARIKMAQERELPPKLIDDNWGVI